MKWYDLSLPINDGMPVYPGDPEVSVSRVLEHESDGLQLSRLIMGSHTGTHLDAPRHFLANGASVSELPLARFCRPALVVACAPRSDGLLDLNNLDLTGVMPGDALLLATGWEKQWGRPAYFADCPHFAAGSSAVLLQLGINLLGVDLPTVCEAGDPDHPENMHVSLLGSHVTLVENLTNLQELVGRRIEFFAFPLKLTAGDGSPVRAVARAVDF